VGEKGWRLKQDTAEHLKGEGGNRREGAGMRQRYVAGVGWVEKRNQMSQPDPGVGKEEVDHQSTVNGRKKGTVSLIAPLKTSGRSKMELKKGDQKGRAWDERPEQ